jgi:hypothetical protein
MTHSSSLRFRQVHLDFHTSEHIADIGKDFDPDHFVRRLKDAHVDSITLFSRCHHGWIYHDTKFPYKHPNLDRNLLAEQIAACHKADIRCPIYITVGWDVRAASENPGWIEVDQQGKLDGATPLSAGWNKLCFASPYLDFVQAQTAEVLDMFGDEVDGLFFDIMFVNGVHSSWALAEFDRLNLDAASPKDQKAMRGYLLKVAVEKLSSTVRDRNKTCGLFFNSGHVAPQFKSVIEAHYSHLEVESLPTGGWGYNHFPIAARYSRTLNKQFLGMTGKFGESWGHFNSYKPQAALEYECLLMLALGGRCSIGDQLHPLGELDAKTYELIGSVYQRIEALEPWQQDCKPVADIAVIHTEAYSQEHSRLDHSNVGAYRLLNELKHQFDFIDEDADFGQYKLIILPDIITLSETLNSKLDHYLASGGAAILSGYSGRQEGSTNQSANYLPASIGESILQAPTFLETSHSQEHFVIYAPAYQLTATSNASIVVTAKSPYFNRTYKHFCSHAHAPLDAASPTFPAIVQKGKVIQFAHPVFHEYAEHPALDLKNHVQNAILQLIEDAWIQAELPTTVQAYVLTKHDGVLVHLLHYVPERRGSRLDIVEDRLPVRTFSLSLRGSYREVQIVPSQTLLPIRSSGERTTIDVPDFDGHLALFASF